MCVCVHACVCVWARGGAAPMVAAGGEGEGLEGESSQRGDDDNEAMAGGGDGPGRDAGAVSHPS